MRILGASINEWKGYFVGLGLKALSRMTHGRPLFRWLLPRTKFDYEREVGELTHASVIMAPLLWIARTLPQAPLIVKSTVGDEEEVLRDHALPKLIRRPNRYFSGFILWMATLISLVIDGNAYWIKIRNRGGGILELWYVPHWLLEPKYPQDGSVFISHYEYRPGGQVKRLEVEDVVHFRYGIDPNNTRKGFSQVKALLREVFTDEEASNFTAALLRNNGVPGVIIAPKDVGYELDKKSTKQAYKDQFGGDNRGEPMVSNGPVEVTEFGFNPQQMDLGRIREIPEERVTAMLGVPAAVVGFGTGLQQTKVGATMKELREMAYEQCIIPTQRLITEELRAQLLPDFDEDTDNMEIEFDLSDVRVLQEDQTAIWRRSLEAFRAGAITRARFLQEIGRDAEPSDEIYLLPFSSVAVPAGELPPPRNPAPQPPTEEAKSRGRKADLSRDEAALVRALNRDLQTLTDVWGGELIDDFENLGRRMAALFRSVIDQPLTAGLNGHEQKGDLEDEIDADRILQEADLSEDLGYGPHYLRVSRSTVNTINTVIGLGIELPDRVEQAIVAAGGTRRGLVDLTGQTRQAVFEALRDGRAEGEGAAALARRIETQVAAGPWGSPEIRAQVIARTETKYAQNVSSLEAYKTSDTVTAIRVVDAQLGDASCDICRERDGDIVTFADAEYLAREEHPNGTMSFVPIVDPEGAQMVEPIQAAAGAE